jgi:hypothetical protein
VVKSRRTVKSEAESSVRPHKYGYLKDIDNDSPELSGCTFSTTCLSSVRSLSRSVELLFAELRHFKGKPVDSAMNSVGIKVLGVGKSNRFAMAERVLWYNYGHWTTSDSAGTFAINVTSSRHQMSTIRTSSHIRTLSESNCEVVGVSIYIIYTSSNTTPPKIVCRSYRTDQLSVNI